MKSLKLKIIKVIIIFILALNGCRGRKIYKEFSDFGVTFETDSQTINKYTSNLNTRLRGDSDTIKYLSSDEDNIKKLAFDLWDEAEKRDIAPIDFIINFVQSLGYRFDSTIGYDDFPKYPDETIYEGNGDCEDTSYVLYSLLEAVGYDVVLIDFPDHMMVGIACEEKIEGVCGSYYYKSDEKRYYPIETTQKGWSLGTLPNRYKNVSSKPIKNSYTEDYRALVCTLREKENKKVRFCS